MAAAAPGGAASRLARLSPVETVDPALRERFDGWLRAAEGRYVPPLRFADLRRGVRALSSLYVERRGESGFGARALEGEGKRAAFATYYAALHFLTTHRLLAAGLLDAAPGRVLDLGCGTGAAGAAASATLGSPEVHGLDRSGWALGEARHTYAAFRCRGRTRRGALPGAFPRARPGDLLVLGWVVNECDPGARGALLSRVEDALERGAGLLLLEPLARGAAPWWPEWQARLAGLGAHSEEWQAAVERPELVARMDGAAGLRHEVLGARALLAAPREAA